MKTKEKWNIEGQRKGKWTFLLALVALVLCGCGRKEDSLEKLLREQEKVQESSAKVDQQSTGVSGETDGNQAQGAGQQTQETGEKMATLWVHICGYVKTPGIYELPLGSRLYDGLMAAGGFLEGADETALNLADFLEDGSQIYVPALVVVQGDLTGSESDVTRAKVQSGLTGSNQKEITKGAANKNTSQSALININTADQALLETLPGIGASRAQAIIAYRQEQGPFQTTQDIQKVSGIKSAIFEKMKELITVEE